MANDKRRKLNVGDTVRLKGRKKTAKVRALLNDITGGVMLTDYLDDFRCWNADDLRIVRRARHLMTNHPKFTESHDSEARKSGSRTSTGSRKPCKPFLAIQDGMRGKQEMYTILRCPYCKVDHKGIVLLTDLPEKCPIRRAARISDKTSKAKR